MNVVGVRQGRVQGRGGTWRGRPQEFGQTQQVAG